MAEELKVEPDDLDAFAGKVQNLGRDAEAARSYANKWLDISSGEARIYAHVKGIADQVKKNLDANYSQMALLADSAATELVATAEMYRTTDSGTAQQLDKTYADGQK
jgi:hypothetical protein